MKRYDFVKELGEIEDVAAIHSWLDRALKYLMNGSYTIVITKVVKKRSKAQNRLMWLWFTCMEKSTGELKEKWHDHYCMLFLREEVVTPDGKVEYRIGHTSTLNTAQMSDFLDKVQADAATEWGIILPSPEDDGYDDFRLYYERYV